MILYQLDPVQDSNDVTRQHATKSVLTSGLHSEPLGNRGWGAMSAYCTMALYCSNPTSTDPHNLFFICCRPGLSVFHSPSFPLSSFFSIKTSLERPQYRLQPAALLAGCTGPSLGSQAAKDQTHWAQLFGYLPLGLAATQQLWALVSRKTFLPSTATSRELSVFKCSPEPLSNV